jgi:Septum formation initiator
MAIKRSKKKKKRMIILTLFCFAVISVVFYSIGKIFKEASYKAREKQELIAELETLKDKSEELKVEVNKLQDKEYIARYVREKFLYSGKNEFILRIK